MMDILKCSLYALPFFYVNKEEPVLAELAEAKRIMKVSRDYFGLTEKQQLSKGRYRGYVMSRNIAMLLIRERTHLSLSATGKLFNISDHSTVLNSLNRLKELVSIGDVPTILAFNEISDKVRNRQW